MRYRLGRLLARAIVRAGEGAAMLFEAGGDKHAARMARNVVANLEAEL